MTPPSSRSRGAAIWSGAALASLAAISATPFLLDGLAPHGMDWNRLSDISQTYGALSAIFSAAALVGIVLSIAHQARQTRIQHEEAHRSAHRELTLLTLNDPAFLVCWEPPNTPVTQERWRQLLVSNLIVSMWSTDFKLNLCDEPTIRSTLLDYFRGEVGRAYWANSAPSWHRLTESGADRRLCRFVRIADEAYAAAVSTGPPVPSTAYFVEPTPPPPAAPRPAAPPPAAPPGAS
ncbi:MULTISPECIES: DUF6082 family protein [Streptomyces]|uniref:DUF6082 family protein n=1 Tax=Streptomyces TaxID=1883 RepID=UPI0006EB5C67|nr:MULTISPECIES: DUF6082 family protein [Streptomyces]